MHHAAPNDRDDGERAGAALDQDGFFCDDPKPSFGHFMVLFWAPFGVGLDTFWCFFGYFWCYFGYLLVLVWIPFSALGTLWCWFGYLLALFLARTGT